MIKSQEYLNEQAEVAQILRDGMVRGLGSPGIADLILQSDWLTERDHRVRQSIREAYGKVGVLEDVKCYQPQRVVDMSSKRKPSGDAA